MFVNINLIFIFDLVRKIMQIIYMYVYVTECFENNRAELTQAESTQGRLGSGADLTSGRVDPLAGGWICREYTTVRPTCARPLSSKPLPVSGGGSEKKKKKKNKQEFLS